jgi:putative drug exporter of the RND superfamily
MHRPRERLPWWRLVVQRRRLLLAAWALLALAVAPLARSLPDRLQGTARIDGSESLAVEELLQGALASDYARYAVLVVRNVPSPGTPAGGAVLRRLVDELEAEPVVGGVFSYLTMPDMAFLAEDGNGFILIAGLARDGAGPDRQIVPLRQLTERLAGELQSEHPGATLRWTGEAALNLDLRATSTRDVERAERRVLPVTALFLLFAFGAVVAAALPVAAGALAIAVTLGLAAVLAGTWSLTLLLQSVVTMLGLGLGIDYALLMVSRFRDALAVHGNGEAAAEEAARHAGHTILVSAACVALGFLVLLSVPLNELRGVAAGGLLVVIVSALVATTLLPGVLAMLGPRVDLGRLSRASARESSLARWRRWGTAVTARPWLALAVGGIPLLLLAAQAPRMRTGFPRGDWLPASMESAQALHELQAMGRSGLVQGIRLVIELPPDSPLWSQDGWDQVSRFALSLERDPRVARVRSLVGAVEEAALDRASFMELPPDLWARLIRGSAGADGRLLMVEVLPGEALDGDAAVAFVRELRLEAARMLGVPGAAVRVGGLPAFNADYRDAVAGRFWWIVAMVVGGTMLGLFVAFRSILVPVKAIALNLLSVAAAFGLVTLVFQEGHGASLLGVAQPLGSVFSSLPVVVFCIVFGLSMDYEIFLITRVQEVRRSGVGDRAAIVEGLGRTGKVITNAAAVMLVVFAAFTLGDVLMTKMLGFTLAAAVFLDATLVRMLVGPALLQLAGHWNWWPGPLGRTTG